MEVSTTADEIEFEIKRLPRDGFRAMVYILRRTMVAARHKAVRVGALCGFEEPYRLGKGK